MVQQDSELRQQHRSVSTTGGMMPLVIAGIGQIVNGRTKLTHEPGPPRRRQTTSLLARLATLSRQEGSPSRPRLITQHLPSATRIRPGCATLTSSVRANADRRALHNGGQTCRSGVRPRAGQVEQAELTWKPGFRRMEAMVTYRTHSIEFKRQVVQESLPARRRMISPSGTDCRVT